MATFLSDILVIGSPENTDTGASCILYGFSLVYLTCTSLSIFAEEDVYFSRSGISERSVPVRHVSIMVFLLLLINLCLPQ